MALWHHHRALIEGCLEIQKRGKDAWRDFVRVRNLPQYADCETSVIEGWRKFTKNSVGVPPDQQRDQYAINYAVIFDSLKRRPEEGASLLKQYPGTVAEAASRGDVDFFKRLGRYLGKSEGANYLQDFNYAHAVLVHWITGFLWLAPERVAAEYLASRFNRKIRSARASDQALRHFKKTKAAYGLRSHRRALISEIKSDGSIVLTPYGLETINSVSFLV